MLSTSQGRTQTLWFSCPNVPQIPRDGHGIHDLPEEEFIKGLKELNGTPPEVLENPE